MKARGFVSASGYYTDDSGAGGEQESTIEDKPKKNGQTEEQRLSEIVTINGNKYHKNTSNLFAVIGNKINSLFGGNPNYFVDKKSYDPVEDTEIHELFSTSVAGIGGVVLGKGVGLLFKGLANRGTIEVTEASIAKALEGSTMQTLQGRVSLPMIQRYVRMLQEGHVAPPIKVADGIIVEGNHRYIAGRLFGVEPSQVPYVVSPSQMNRVVPIQKTIVDLVDWGGH